MKKVLITGANSYIGTSFEKWVQEQHPDEFQIDTVDMIGESWREKSFEGYDVVFHVAGIAHADVGKVSEETKKFYYKVNRDLAIETAKKAKQASVNQFVLMSSMIIYGESARLGKKKVINKMTEPQPANFYGDSKWQADKGVRKLESKEFHVAVVRPPMIYGKGSKGNYPLLSKFAKKLPIFPDIQNERSMLHIDNLCEFLSLLFLNGEGGIYFPQNKEYVQTSKLVKEIAMISNHKIKVARLFNPFVWIAGKIPGKISGLVNKAFGNMVYEKNMSKCFGGRYQIRSFKESIKITERNKKKVLILVNHEIVIYNFRKELVERLLSSGYEVIISCPYGERIRKLEKMGCKCIDIKLDRHGKHLFKEFKLISEYISLAKIEKPDIILSYTIKPNLYGSIMSRICNIPILINITGLGSAIKEKSLLSSFILFAYKVFFRNARKVYCQNSENYKFLKAKKVICENGELLPGSGVNLEEFDYQEYNYSSGEKIKFGFVSRIMKEKGIEEYLQVAKEIRAEHGDKVEFHICGFCEENYKDILEIYEKKKIIIYHGMLDNMKEFYKEINCIIHPSYHEGMANVVLEASACGRPAIVSDIPGCKEAVSHGKTGYCAKVKDVNSLKNYVEKFLNLSLDEQRKMGKNARQKMVEQFNREIIIGHYMQEIKSIEKEYKNEII